jgi:hypothetical protein
MCKSLVVFLTLFAATAQAGSNYLPTDAERARWTMGDMRSWAIVLDAYQKDHGKQPAVKTLEELQALVQPVYIKYAPMTDAWGNPYRVSTDADGTVRVISAGADGKFDETTWSTAGKQTSFDDDAVVTGARGPLYRSWEYR